MLDKVEDNLSNPDSLLLVANNSYNSIIEYLEQNEQGDKVGITAAGGWIETMYIVVNSTDYDKDKKSLSRLADQKLTLDNLLSYLDEYQSNQDVSGILETLKELKTIYSDLSETKKDGKVCLQKNTNGKMILKGGSKVSMTQEQFILVKKEVNKVRNKITRVEV